MHPSLTLRTNLAGNTAATAVMVNGNFGAPVNIGRSARGQLKASRKRIKQAMYGLDGFCAAAKAAEAEYKRADKCLYFPCFQWGRKGRRGEGRSQNFRG